VIYEPKRYNTDGERAYCAHSSSRNVADGEQEFVWHGFPLAVSFSALVNRLQNVGRISFEDAEILRSEVLDQ
jgi:hypothetical protein